MNKDAIKRGQDLNELFIINTNRQWQQRFWKQAQERLALVHKKSKQDTHYLPKILWTLKKNLLLPTEFLIISAYKIERII